MHHAHNLCSRITFEKDFNVLTGAFETFDWTPGICYGKGSSGGGGTNTVTQSSQPPQQVLDAYTTALNAAQTASSAPLQQYGGPTVAGFTPDQLSAFGTVNSAQGTAAPFINSAQTAINNGTQNLWSGVQPVNASTISQYESPYTQQVYDAQVAGEQNQDAQQQQALKGNAISSGAWGGDRAGVASGILSGQQDLANNQTNTGILQQGYNSALSEANTEQQAQLGANEANSYLDEQAGFGLAGLGSEAENEQLQGASAQLQSGALQQQLGQEELNVPYENFLQAQAYPFQTSSFFTNAAEGTGALEGGTSSTTSPAASQTSQIAGLGLGGLGLLGSAFAARGGRIRRPFEKGGKVRGYGSGGPIDPLDVTIVPSAGGAISGGRGEGPPKPPPAYRADQSAGGLGGTGLNMSGFQGAGKGLSSLFGMFGSSPMQPGGGSNPLDAGSGSALDMGGESNPLDIFSSGSFGSSGASEAGDAAASDESADMLGSIFDFRRGGSVEKTPYAIGGEVLPDVLSGVGDIVGAFFGDPGAGDQGVGLLSDVDGGRTEGEGIEGRAMGSIFGDSNRQGGFRRGGFAHGHFDDGGNVGGQSPTAASMSGQQMPSRQGVYNNMTPQQLQNYLLRLPVGSQQAQQLQQVINQKRSMPNTGQVAQGGFGTQQQPAAAQTPQPMMQRGGDVQHFDYGGNVQDPDSIYIDAPPPDRQSMLPDPDDAQNMSPLPMAKPPVTPLSPVPQTRVALTPAAVRAAKAALPVPPPPGGFGGVDDDGAGLDDGANSTPPSDAPESTDSQDKDPQTVDDDTISKLTGRTRAKADPWMSLAKAGFSMAAGQSPSALENIGKGASAGIEDYEGQRKEADTVNSSVDKLLQEAKQHKDSLAFDQQKENDLKDYRAAMVASKTNPAGQMSSENLNFMADQYLAGDKSVVNGLGYGNTGAMNRVALREAIRQRAVAANMSPADIAEALADYQGTIAEKKTIGTRTGAVKVGAEAVNGAADMALNASAKFDRTLYPDMNKVREAVATGTGDNNVVDFNTTNNTLINEFAAAQNPRGVPRIDDKNHTRDMLDVAYNQGQYATAVNRMKLEIANIKNATNTVRGGKDTSGGAPAAGDSPVITGPKDPKFQALQPGDTFVDSTTGRLMTKH